MKHALKIYNSGISAAESFVIFDLHDLRKQMRQKIKGKGWMCYQLSNTFNIGLILGDELLQLHDNLFKEKVLNRICLKNLISPSVQVVCLYL